MSKPEIKIFLVDDHEVVLNGLKAILNPTTVTAMPDSIELSGEFRVIGTAPDAETMLQRLQHLPSVDLLIVDYELAGMNGVEAAKAAKEQFKHLKTIVFSMHCSTALVQFARQHEVDAFVTKGEGLQRLIEAIRKVMKGDELYPPIGIQNQKSALAPSIGQTAPPEKEQPLSRREREVLCRIAKGMSSQEISKDINIAFNTVEVHRRNLMQKLDIHKVAGLVKYAMEQGITC